MTEIVNKCYNYLKEELMELSLSIIFFIGVILLLTVFRSQFKGALGELAVSVKLKDLDKSKYRKLHDIKLKNTSNNTSSTQIDHIVVSTYGIFVIETKGYKQRAIREKSMVKKILDSGRKLYLSKKTIL